MLNLDLIIDDRIKRLYNGIVDPREALKIILKNAYPSLDYRTYINKPSRLKRCNFSTLSDFIQEIFRLTERVNMCLEDSPHSQLTDRELFEFFIGGPNHNEKMILIEREIFSIEEAHNLLSRIEATRTYYQQSEYNISKSNPRNTTTEKKYCTYHKTNKHSSNECKVLSNKSNDKYSHRNNGVSHTIHTRMEKLASRDLLVPKVTINNEHDTRIIIDSGADYDFIFQEAVDAFSLKPYNTTKFSVELADGSSVTVNQMVSFTLTFQNIPHVMFKTYAYILPGLLNTLNLGFKFLAEHNLVIDPKEKMILQRDTVFGSTDNRLTSNSPIKSEENIKDDIIHLVELQKSKNPSIGNIPNIEHEIPLTTNKPIMSREYQVPSALKGELENTLRELEENKIIRRSHSKFSSPVFLIPKKTGGHRMVIDYRQLNEIMDKEIFPIPRIDDILCDLHGGRVYSQLDLNSGFHQINIAEKDKHKTAFLALGMHYEFNKMPFGATNAPRSFQRAMSSLFGHLNFVKVYLDDILIFSLDLKAHLSHLIKVFKIITLNKISINFAKSNFLPSEVKYLGCIINEKGISPDLELVKKHNFVSPRKKKDLQKLLGFINYFRPFIQDLSKDIIPITNKLKSDNKCFSWTDADDSIINTVKDKILSKGLLHHPNPKDPFILKCDASDYGIGGVLYQGDRIIRFFSKKLSSAEINYTITEKECLAILKSLDFFHTLSYGRKILIYTDNRNITFFKSAEKRRTQRWKIAQEYYNYELIHISGKENQEADYLSRSHSIVSQMQSDISKQVYDLHHRLAHPGISRTYLTIKNIICHPKLKKITKDVVQSCSHWQIHKESKQKYGKITGNYTSEKPF